MSSLEIPFSWYHWGKRKSEKNNVGITQSLSVHWSKLTDSDHNTGLNMFFNYFVGMNQPYLFCLCVLCSLKNEFFYWLDFIVLFLGLFKGPSHWMLGVRSCNTCQKHCVLCQTHYLLKTVTIEGKVSPVLTNQSSTFVEPWEVSKLYSSE